MIIIQLSGGLGNQMFQYALYQQLKKNGRQVKIDTVTEYQGENCRNIQLPFFNTEYEIATKKEINTMTDSFLSPIHRIRRKLFGRKRNAYHEEGHLLNKEIFHFDTMYLEGCWQSEKYFTGVKDTLISTLTLKEEYRTESEKSYLERITQTESVSIHIRRGDYLTTYSSDFIALGREYYEDDLRILVQRAGQGHALLLTAGELVTAGIGLIQNAYLVQTL